jgi:hypothetical protein
MLSAREAREMPDRYPKPIALPFGPFPVVALVSKALPKERSEHMITFSSSDGGAVTLVDGIPRVGTTKCILFFDERSFTDHFNNGANPTKEKAKEHRPFWFCPGVDEPKLGWKTRKNDDIEKAVVEVYAADLPAGPVSKKEIPVADLAKNPDETVKVTGSMPFKDALDFDAGSYAGEFPDKLLTVAHSPYQVRLTITKKNDSKSELYPSVSWSFFHVLADRTIDLTWGDDGEIPNTQRDDIDAYYRGGFADKEKAVLNALKANPPGQNQEIVLDAIFHSAAGKNGRPTCDKNHNALRMLWGDGPRLPMKAQAFVLRADGRTRATAEDSAKALGKVKFVWDWDEGPGNVPDLWMLDRVNGPNLRIGHGDIQRAWLREHVTVVEPDGQPHGAINCPKKFGGKRGDLAKPIFPKQEATAPLGFEVEPVGPGGGRPWASIGKSGDAGAKRAQTGAIFQPSRFPGDRYRVHVYLLGAGNANDLPAALPNDAGGPLATQIEGLGLGERPPRAVSGLFTVTRKTKVNFIVSGCALDGGSIATLKATYERLINTKIETASHDLPDDAVRRGNRYQTLVKDKVLHDNAAKGYEFVIDMGLSKAQDANPNRRELITAHSYRAWLTLLESKRHVSFAVYHNPIDAESQKALWPGSTLRLTGGKKVGLLRVSPFVPATSEQRKKVTKLVPKRLAPGELRQLLLYEGIVLDPPGGAPTDGDTLESGTTHGEIFATRKVSYTRVERTFTASVEPSHRITVRLTGSHAGQTSLLLQYDRASFGNTYSRTLNKTAQKRLRKLFQDAFDAYLPADAADPLVVEVSAAWNPDDDRDSTRIENLNRLLDELVSELLVGKEQAKSVGLTEETYNDKMSSSIKSGLWVSDGFWETVANEDFPGIGDGIIYYYLERLWSEISTPSGASCPVLSHPQRAIGYQQNGFNGVPLKKAGYDPGTLLSHELGHFFYRKHASTKHWSFDTQGNDETMVHVYGDGCIMNYDVDPTQMEFCAACILIMRGWNIEARDNVADVNESRRLRELAIDNEGDPRIKTWRKLSLAYYVRRSDAAASQRLIGEALQLWDGTPLLGWTSPEALNVLRAGISGYYYHQQAGQAQPWFKRLVQATSNKYDLQIKAPNLALGRDEVVAIESIRLVELLDGGEALTSPEGSYQYVNLPRDPKFVDTNEVTSLDRLGKRVRVKVSYTTPGEWQFAAKLMAHARNSRHAGGVAPDMMNIDKTQFIHIEETKAGTTRPDGTAVIEFDLPTDAGGDWFLVEVRDSLDTALQSPAFVTMRAFFVVRVICEGNAVNFAFNDDARFRELLDQAFVSHGIYVIPVGSTQLRNYGPLNYLLDPNGWDFQKLAARETRGQPCAFGAAGTYSELEPYLFYAVFVDQIIAGLGISDFETDEVDLTQAEFTLPRAVRARRFQGRGAPDQNPSCLWNPFPDGTHLPPDLPTSCVRDSERDAYARGGHPNDKKWFVRIGAKITASDNPADMADAPLELTLGDVEGVEDDHANAPGKCSKLKIKLAAIKNHWAQATRAKLTVQVLCASSKGGLIDPNGEKAVPVISTRLSYTTVAKPIDAQVSALIHEIGHALDLAPPPGGVGMTYVKAGSHCKMGLGNLDPLNLGPDQQVDAPDGSGQKKVRQIAECVMYEAVADPPLHDLCDTCGRALRVRACSVGLPVRT